MHITDQTANEFYNGLYCESAGWNMPFPNRDQAIRAGKILPLVSSIASELNSQEKRPLNIVEVGCGLGWLTYFLRIYGTSVGIDPVQTAVDKAHLLFSNIEFATATLEEFIVREDHRRFDVAVASEVIEHVPYAEQKQFLLDMASLINVRGSIILTTPRGELFKSWEMHHKQRQPIENWLSEKQLDRLAEQCGLQIVWRERCFAIQLAPNFYVQFIQRTVKRLFTAFGLKPPQFSMTEFYQVIWLRKIDT